MKKEGLLEEPQFDKPEFYLTSGERTEVTQAIKEFADSVPGKTDYEKAKNLLIKIHKEGKTPGKIQKRLEIETGSREKARRIFSSMKFRRSADEILRSNELTGCCDFSTLFVALARASGIPAMQIITVLDQDGFQFPDANSVGHFFTAVYLRDSEGKKGEWRIIDTAARVKEDDQVAYPFKKDDRNIINKNGDQFYAIAYTRDYSDIVVRENDKERRIDCIRNMVKIQTDAFNQSDKDDIRFYGTVKIDSSRHRSRRDDDDAR